jgi:hypothetical protein
LDENKGKGALFPSLFFPTSHSHQLIRTVLNQYLTKLTVGSHMFVISREIFPVGYKVLIERPHFVFTTSEFNSPIHFTRLKEKKRKENNQSDIRIISISLTGKATYSLRSKNCKIFIHLKSRLFISLQKACLRHLSAGIKYVAS